jgi:endonuclease/exonuclease/phosphatase family metal-dependent hydrolase
MCLLVACGGASTQAGPSDAGSPEDGGIADATLAHDGASLDAATHDAHAVTDARPDALTGPLVHLRVMAANITSGTQQSYEAPGIRIFQGLAPDVALVQEMKYAGGSLRTLVDTAFGKDFSYYVEPRMGGIPNGIVSRYPIVESGTWTDTNVTDRAYAWARIDVPGPTDLWAVSLHLLTTGITQRDNEAKELVTNIQGKIPAGDYLVLGGDLNTDAQDELALMDLGAVVVTTGPFPVDQNLNPNTSTNRNRPHDWVLASPGLHARAIPVSIGASMFPAGLVFDSRVYAPLTEVAPIMVTDSAVTGMQHMPVVRDFTLESPGDAGVDAASDDAGDAGDDADAN